MIYDGRLIVFVKIMGGMKSILYPKRWAFRARFPNDFLTNAQNFFVTLTLNQTFLIELELTFTVFCIINILNQHI